jgi:nucleotidyltransferase substrate binding protein (TIGR01987 family)
VSSSVILRFLAKCALMRSCAIEHAALAWTSEEKIRRMNGVDQKIHGLDLFIEKIKSLKYVEAVYLFGSRSRGEHQERSDIDIAMDCPSATEAQWNYILDLVENIPTLIKIDCVRLDQLQETNPLQKSILRDKIILYKKENMKMDPTFQESFQKTERALNALELVVNHPMDKDRFNIDATIQRFEFTVELFWKLLKKLLLSKGVITQYPRDVLKEAYAGSLIHDEKIWIHMLHDRNQTSHTYDEDLANKIYENIKMYVPVFRKTLNELSEKSILN